MALQLIGEGIAITAEGIAEVGGFVNAVEGVERAATGMIDEVERIETKAVAIYTRGRDKITDYFRRTKRQRTGVPIIKEGTDMKDDLPDNVVLAHRTFRDIALRQGHSSIKPLSRTTVMAYGKRKRSMKRKKRTSKRRKFATKSAVKKMIKDGPSIHFKRGQNDIQSLYLGDIIGVQPSPTFGKKFIGIYSWWTSGQLGSSLTSALARMPAAGPTNPIPDDKATLWLTKLRHDWDLHNPMTEDVIATFWLIETECTTDIDPYDMWVYEWGQMREVAISTPILAAEYTSHAQDFFTYPTEFPEWKRYFRIKKKWKTVFKPGDNKKLIFKHAPIRYVTNENDIDAATFVKGKSYFLMYELRGIPTHQNTGGSLATSNVNNLSYSPGALDCVHKRSYFVAASRLHGKDVRYANNLVVPTGGYTNQVTAQGQITVV